MTNYPLQINNGHGEILTFERLVATPNGDRLEISIVAQPQSGPPMHVHWQQEEGLTVVTGRIGYQIKGEAPRYAEAGETVVFAPGVAHRWWVEGDQPLHGTGYVEPAHNMAYFLSEVYRSMRPTCCTNTAASLRYSIFPPLWYVSFSRCCSCLAA